jgi:tetratricopeptide (TPR) repeat protein
LLLALFGLASAGGTAKGETSVTAADRELVRMAEQAKAAFATRMEPPPINLSTRDMLARDATAVVRDIARERYDASINALLVEAQTPERAPRIKDALRELVDAGDAKSAEAIFTEIAERKVAEGSDARRDAAAAVCHSVALVELPAALAPFIKPPDEFLPFAPLGEKTAPAYARAAELDAADPWTWIVLALLAKSPEGFNSAMRNALNTAQAAEDRRAMIVMLHVFGLTHAGVGGGVEGAYVEALRLARAWTSQEPESLRARHYLARGLNRVGDALSEQERYDEAAAVYGEALAIRARLAEAEPEDPGRQIDLITAHLNMATVSLARGDKAQAQQHWNEHSRIHNALLARDPSKASINPWHSGGAIHILIMAGGLTLVIGLIALARYRRVVTRYMTVAATASTPGAAERIDAPQHAAPDRELPLVSIDVAERRFRASPFRAEAIAGAARAAGRAAWVYAIAALAFASVSAVLWLKRAGIEITWAQMTGQVLTWVWPVVFTLALLWGPDRRRQALPLVVYLAVLLAFCAHIAFLSETPPKVLGEVTVLPFFQPLYLVVSQAAPSLFLLLFLNRRVRAIGPFTLVLMVVVCTGSVATLVGASTYAGVKAISVVPIFAEFYLLPVQLLGMLLFLPLGWLAIVWLRRQYDRKRLSDQSLVHDSIWLFQTFTLFCIEAVRGAGPTGWLTLGAFAVYKLITWAGLRPLAVSAASRLPARLLLLRTFGFRKRSEFFFDLLGARWRYAGPIQLIGAPDLAGRSIDPDKFLDFLSGRLRHRFIIDPGDLECRITGIDNRPDPDGRYRVNEFFCGNHAWRPAVRRLMAESDLVAMDLRGFSATKQGCLFELQSLIDLVPVARVVLLTDRTTDAPFLHRTLAECWRRMDAASPNREARGALSLLETGGRDAAAVEALLSIADGVLVHAKGPSISLKASAI